VPPSIALRRALTLALVATLVACGDSLTPPTRAVPLASSPPNYWSGADFPDYSTEPDFQCQAHLGDDPATCLGIVATSTADVAPNGMSRQRLTFSKPVARVDRVFDWVPEDVWCQVFDRVQPSRLPSSPANIRGSGAGATVRPSHHATPPPRATRDLGPNPGPGYIVCHLQQRPELHGVAYNAAGAVVATNDYAGYTDGLPKSGIPWTGSMQLASGANDIVRVEFTTPLPSNSSFDWAVIGATPTVSCTPATPVRGEQVDCSTTGFAVVGTWTFTPTNPALPIVTDVSNSAGAHWVGGLVADGKVTLDGWIKASDYPDPTKKQPAGQVGVAVTARPWSRSLLQLPGIPTFGGAGTLQPAPEQDSTGWTMTWGLYQPGGLDLSTKSVSTPNGGPNKGYKTLVDLPKLKRTTVFLNPALDGVGAWAARQTGRYRGLTIHPQLHIPFCTMAAFATLKPEAARHEGLTGAPDSHYGIWQTEFAQSQLPARWEALVATSDAELVGAVRDSYDTFINSPAEQVPQKALDTRDDISAIRRWSGNCEFIYQP
jgi:hypothetical protein